MRAALFEPTPGRHLKASFKRLNADGIFIST